MSNLRKIWILSPTNQMSRWIKEPSIGQSGCCLLSLLSRKKCKCVPRRSPLPGEIATLPLSPKNSPAPPSSDIPRSDAFLFHPVLSSCHTPDTYPSRPSSPLYTKTNFSLIRRHTLLERRNLNLFNIGYFAFCFSRVFVFTFRHLFTLSLNSFPPTFISYTFSNTTILSPLFCLNSMIGHFFKIWNNPLLHKPSTGLLNTLQNIPHRFSCNLLEFLKQRSGSYMHSFAKSVFSIFKRVHFQPTIELNPTRVHKIRPQNWITVT